MAERINQNNFKEKAIRDDKLVLVDFYSDSCVPCKVLSVVLAELEEAYPEQLYIGKVNTNFEKTLVEEYEVSSTPTLLFLKQGNVVERLTGIQDKADLDQLIQKHL